MEDEGDQVMELYNPENELYEATGSVFWDKNYARHSHCHQRLLSNRWISDKFLLHSLLRRRWFTLTTSLLDRNFVYVLLPTGKLFPGETHLRIVAQ